MRKIYYFSGTGNTFALAREIADRIGAELISIPTLADAASIHVDAESIGIVFPSYLAPLSGLPLIVERFIRKINNIGAHTVFAVCNCGGYESVNALPSLHRVDTIISSCGGKLHAAYSLRLPMNNLDYDHIPIPINRDTEEIIRKSKAKINRICDSIIKKRRTKYRLVKKLFLYLMEPIYRLMRPAVIKELKQKAQVPADSELDYEQLMPLTDNSITVDAGCTGCGICEKVCPVNNIEIVNCKPEFQHGCEICFACDEWCPTDAIHHWSRANGVKYHHPEVRLTDMLNGK